MNLNARLARLEASDGASLLTTAECDAAIERYTDTYHAAGGAFPLAIDPTTYRTAIGTTRNPAQQRLLACMMPGDDDI